MGVENNWVCLALRELPEFFIQWHFKGVVIGTLKMSFYTFLVEKHKREITSKGVLDYFFEELLAY